VSDVEQFELTAVFQPDEGGWFFAYLAEIPGVATQGRSLAEARMMLADALREYMLAIGQRQEPPEEAPDAERLPFAVTFDV
jgi:predicted RNase H-like HicB family nuclease